MKSATSARAQVVAKPKAAKLKHSWCKKVEKVVEEPEVTSHGIPQGIRKVYFDLIASGSGDEPAALPT